MSKQINCSQSQHPDFFEPKPFLRKDCEEKTERRKPILKKMGCCQKRLVSILGKRQLEDVYGYGMNDNERYGQEIPPDFFKTNGGHNVFPYIVPSPNLYNPIHSTSLYKDKVYENKVNYWRDKYLSKG